MLVKPIVFCGRPVVLACDGDCAKAWGISSRPKRQLSEDDPDDYEFLADPELGVAPADPGTTEGGEAKPADYADPMRQNRWCARECERSVLCAGGALLLPDYSSPRPNRAPRTAPHPTKEGV